MYSKTVIVGRVGRDPELRYLSSGVAVADFSLAEDRGFADKKQATWWKITVWREAAESVSQHVHKGDVLIVDGQATASAWVADDGEARATLELTAHSWRFGGGGSRDGASGRDADDSVPF